MANDRERAEELQRLLDASRGIGSFVEEPEEVEEVMMTEGEAAPISPISSKDMENVSAAEPVNKINQTRTTGRDIGQNVNNAGKVEKEKATIDKEKPNLDNKKKEMSLEELIAQTKRDNEDRNTRASIMDAVGNLGQALAQYGAKSGAAKAALASGSKIASPNLKFATTPNAAKLARQKGVGDIESLLASAKEKRLGSQFERQMGVQEKAQEGAAEERRLRREERQEARDERREDRKLDRELREQKQSEKLQEQDRRQIERYTDRAQKTDQFKEAQKLVNKAGTVRRLLKDANIHGGQSLAMLGPVVAKGIAGEVGVLTEQDVTRYIKNPTLAGGLKDSLLKISQGRLSDVSYENLDRLINIMETKAREERSEVMDRTAKQLSKNSNLSVEEARTYLDPDYNKEAVTPSSDRVRVQLPSGQTGSIDRDKLEAFKQKNPNAKILE